MWVDALVDCVPGAAALAIHSILPVSVRLLHLATPAALLWPLLKHIWPHRSQLITHVFLLECRWATSADLSRSATLQLAMGITGLVYFAANFCNNVGLLALGCNICLGVNLAASCFTANAVFFVLLAAAFVYDYGCGIDWREYGFLVLNVLGALSNVVIIAGEDGWGAFYPSFQRSLRLLGGAVAVASSLSCTAPNDLGYSGHAYGSVAIAVGCLQLLLSGVFTWGFAYIYRNALHALRRRLGRLGCCT
jgi:hypothetical protein